jgi:hypothetical protein
MAAEEKLAKSEDLIRNTASNGFSLVVIGNSTGGLKYVHGDKKALETSTIGCTLYLHHPLHPNIPSYHRNDQRMYVPLKNMNHLFIHW